MCFGDSGGTTSTVNNVSSIPPWVQQAGAENFAAAKAISSQPFQTLGTAQERVSGQTPLQTQANSLAQGNVNNWQPYIKKAAGATDAMSDPAAMRTYMNPYIENALQPQLRMLDRQRDDQTRRINAGAAQAGAFGDARQGVLQGAAERDYMTGVSDVTGQGYANAFDRAMAAAQGQAQLYGNLGQATQTMGQADVSNLFNLGEQQRQIEQQMKDYQFSEYARAQNFPRDQLGVRISALSGVPFPQGSTSTTTAPGPNQFAQNLGAFGLLAGGAGSLYKAFS